MSTVSVIMGVYNGADLLPASVASILAQSYTDIEFIICDDGSTDRTFDVISALALQDPRIVVLRNPTNLGLAATLNNCLARASGEFVARMDDDDISAPHRLSEQVRFLTEHPEYALVGASRRFYDEDGVWGKGQIGGERSARDIYFGRTFVHPTVMMRASVLAELGGYSVNPVANRTEDFELWCRLYAAGHTGYNLAEPLLDYFQSSASYGKRKFRYRINEMRIRLMWRTALGVPLWGIPMAFKPILAGLIPRPLMRQLHLKRYAGPTRFPLSTRPNVTHE